MTDARWTGTCRGGPLDGHTVTSRFPKGLLVVDRPAARVWIYDYSAGSGEFAVREQDGRPEDRERRFAAALGADFDVISIGGVAP